MNKFVLKFQPANSLDQNILDLDFFQFSSNTVASGCTIHYHKQISTLEDSIDQLHWKKLNNFVLTLQKVMECLILCNGDNKYEIPQMQN